MLGRYEDAITDYDRALELDPGNSDAQFRKALTYVTLQKKENATAAFEAAIILFQTADSPRAAAAQQQIDKLQSDTD